MLLELADYYPLLFLAPFLALELWDMAFGTFRNPGARETPVAAGFYHGGSARLSAMLAFREP